MKISLQFAEVANTLCLCKVNSAKYIAMTVEKKPVRRSPRGVMSDKPIYTRLTAEERANVLRISRADHCSTSSMTRRLILLGLAVYETQATACP